MAKLTIEKVELQDLTKYLPASELAEVVDSYINRKNIEEVETIRKLGGESYLIDGLQTSTKSGIDSSSINGRIRQYGQNKLEPKLAKSLWDHIQDACGDLLIKILIGVCIGMFIVNLLFNRENIEADILDTVSIMIAVVLCVGVASINNYQKDRQYLTLYRVSQNNKHVLVERNGTIENIQASQVVVGDVVRIQEGMEIPADGLVIQSHDLKIDESQLTGENESIMKDTYEKVLKLGKEQALEESKLQDLFPKKIPSCIVLSGSKVLSGNGKLVALQVGKNTASGKIHDIVLGEEDPTPLQEKLEILAENIGKFGMFSAVGIVFVLVVRAIIENMSSEKFDAGHFSAELLSYVLIGLSTAVASIPEGLPLAVTIALAYSARKMIKDNNLVRKIDACETMGGANTICSDKTGTLTQNKMQIKVVFVPDAVSNQTADVQGLSYSELFPANVEQLITLNFACNNNANLHPPSGSKTDLAVLEFFESNHIDYKSIQEKYIREDTRIFSFSSNRKRSAIILDLDQQTLMCKGAAEYILASSSRIQYKDGSIGELDEKTRTELRGVIDDISRKALRPVAFAYKELAHGSDLNTKDAKGVYEIEKNDLVISAIVGIGDPLREGVNEAISKCKRAGIKLRMITGDNLITARSIAQEAGILSSEGIVMEGEDFMTLVGGVVCASCRTAVCDCARTKVDAKKLKKRLRVDTIDKASEFDKIYQKLEVLARARPEDKYALVVGLKERGFVVAVTGDGANDAPALLKADVGFAMGASGTEIAKEASDIVIMDDNISSIVKSVVWGRNVYDNIRKFLQFQLTINVSAVSLIAIGSIVLSSPIFTPVQLLWINLVMDTLASLALAAESPSEDVLNRAPHSRNDKIISNKMIKHIIGQSIYQITTLLVIIFAGDKFIPENLPDIKDVNGKSIIYAPGTNFVRSGRLNYPFSLKDDYHPLEITFGPSRHFTVVFNTFVFLQVFGFFSARRIDDSLNIFQGVHKSYLFLSIVVIVAGVQALLVEFGGSGVEASSQGLSGVQWMICLGFSIGGLVVNFLLKFLPDPKFNIELEKGEKEDLERGSSPSLSGIANKDFIVDPPGSSETQHLLNEE